MNAYVWFQFGSFAYGFSGTALNCPQTLLNHKKTDQLFVELHSLDSHETDLVSFLESILATSKYLLKVDTCFYQNDPNSEIFFVSRHLPELVLTPKSIRLKLTQLEPSFSKPLSPQTANHITRGIS
jgi:hypothetical protein